MPSVTTVRDAAQVSALVESLAARVRSLLGPVDEAVVVGVRRGGVALSRRLARHLAATGVRCDLGTVDIALYRDDAHLALPRPDAGPTELPHSIDGRDVVIVDDVFWTGRTSRAAMDAVLDFGRPRRLWLATLVTRPGRELPIVADASALELAPAPDERVRLHFTEDGHAADAIVLERRDPPGSTS